LILTSGIRKCKFQKVAFFWHSDAAMCYKHLIFLSSETNCDSVFHTHVMFPDLLMWLYHGGKYIVYILPQMS